MSPSPVVPAPDDASERQIRRLERLGLASGAVFLVALAVFVFTFPVTLSPLRLAALSVLATCAGTGLWLRRRFWTVLGRELGRRKQAEQEARAADLAKGQFLSHVSHEIRTPMSGVLGMTELLLTGEINATQREQLEVIRTSCDALLALVDDVLDLSRIEAGRLLLRPRDYSFRDLAGDVLRLLEPRAAERAVDLQLQIDPSVPNLLYGDPVRLRQVLLNLVGNAIRFTRKGSVTVTAEPLARVSPYLRCEVVDTGVGIRPEVQARLFQPFSQGESSASHGFGGTGLGLVITKNIITLMGGEIGFHSTRGVGTTFWFRIPLVKARGRVAQTSDPEADEDARRRARAARRILVVDDRSANRSVALALLRKLGYAAEAVEGGEEALAFLEDTPCAAVLLDVMMPGLDGLETCRRLRHLETGRGSDGAVLRTPVIALSALTSEEERQECLAAGMDAFLPKPFRTRELAEVLDRWTRIEPDEKGDPGGEGLEERLAGLQALGDSTGEDLLSEVMRAFLQQGERDLVAMRRALEAGDAPALAAAAHGLTGSAGLLGAADLAQSSGDLSRRARHSAPSVCAELLARVEKDFREVARRLAP